MGKTIMSAVVSLDGFIADLSGNVVPLFDCYGYEDVAWSFPGTDDEARSTRVSAGKQVAEDPAAEKPRLEEDAARVNAESPIPLPREAKNGGVPFTSSDLTDRLLPGALRAAYRDGRALTPKDLVDQAQVLAATPPFGGA